MFEYLRKLLYGTTDAGIFDANNHTHVSLVPIHKAIGMLGTEQVILFVMATVLVLSVVGFMIHRQSQLQKKLNALSTRFEELTKAIWEIGFDQK